MTRIFSSLVLFIALGFSAACQHSVPATENSKQKAINTTIPVNDFEKQIKEKKDIQIVDVRTPDEFKGGHLKNAFNIDYRNAEFTCAGQIQTNLCVLSFGWKICVCSFSNGKDGIYRGLQYGRRNAEMECCRKSC